MRRFATARMLHATLTIGFGILPARAVAQDAGPARYAPDPAALRRASPSELRELVMRFTWDRSALQRRWSVAGSPQRRGQLIGFADAWLATLRTVAFDSLSQDGRVDYVLLRSTLEHEKAELAREERRMAELAELLPFADTIYALDETRRRMETMVPAAAARTLAGLAATVTRARRAAESAPRPDTVQPAGRLTRIRAFRATELIAGQRQTLERWFRFYDGYDPLFGWWTRAPYQRADSALRGYAQVLRERVVGVRPNEEDPIVGLPIGRDALMEDLAAEMIPYTPEELIAIAQREFAWCEQEMRRAARDMGLGDDWRAALERVKNDYVEPGRMTDLVRDLEREAADYVESHDLVTVPPLARDVWRMEMMTPERQRENPFFTGGEVITVSYPTDAMSEDDKLMSLRGNNVHFARATVFHEMIPGHHLQGFMSARYNAHRQLFATPFWHEGNAFYWELLLWDQGFTRTPEDRVGALFWRMHRAARIIFSLSFHLGTMTPQQAIDFLVDRVGHERANAVAEVRRSFNGSYSPLYQVAYMIGALQFRALHAELVDAGRLTNRAFHDAILHSGSMPVEMVRALLENQPLSPAYRASWRFDGARGN